MVYSHGDVQATPYYGGVEQSDEERHRLLSVGTAVSNGMFQVRVRDGVVVEVIRVEFELCRDCRHMPFRQLATSIPTCSPEKWENSHAGRTCFSALQHAPERRRHTLDLVLEANRPIRLAPLPSASVVQGRRLMLVVVTVDSKQNVLR